MGKRLNNLKRFGIALALSAGLHAGVPASGYGIHKGIEFLRSLPKKQQVMHEDIQKSKADELRAEKEQYVRKLHSALLNGEDINLSSFLIKSEVLDMRIWGAENGGWIRNEEAVSGNRNMPNASDVW